MSVRLGAKALSILGSEPASAQIDITFLNCSQRNSRETLEE